MFKIISFNNSKRNLVTISPLAIVILLQVFSLQMSVMAESGTSNYKVIKVTNGGTVSGKVGFANKYPKQARIKITRDNESCGGIKLSEKFLVSKETKGLQNVLVTVEGIKAGKAPSASKTVTLQQSECTYVPHFQVAEIGPDGVDLILLNEDGIFHNVHSFHSDTTLFNIPHLGEQHELHQMVTEAGVIKIKCDVHDWMSANIVFLKDKPYYSVTDKKGTFSISDIPPGTYTLHAWHEALGVMEKEITITASEEVFTDFIIKGKSKKKK